MREKAEKITKLHLLCFCFCLGSEEDLGLANTKLKRHGRQAWWESEWLPPDACM